MKGSENTDLFEQPECSHHVPGPRERESDKGELVVLFRYGRLENQVGSNERLDNRDGTLETVVSELVSASDLALERYSVKDVSKQARNYVHQVFLETHSVPICFGVVFPSKDPRRAAFLAPTRTSATLSTD